MRLDKRIRRSRFVQQALGLSMAGYFRIVNATNPLAREPVDMDERLQRLMPVIITMWHGQHFMIPFARPKGMRSAVMISKHADAEINAIAAEAMGMDTIRASGAHSAADARRKGGMAGFREAMRALESGITVGLTADVPKGPAKVCGRGVVLLARHSGRPIVPVAYATSRNIDIRSWDEASVGLPFGRAGFVLGDPIFVPAEADDADVERYRDTVRLALNDATRRAYLLAGGASKFHARDQSA
ncbi:MAG TPA: lysophospholipid acyltransferase family protein [Methylomirabilota bacterium]|nr:lysophospholipid acyltransferase family protein [Methylomirabilota bacterium]